MKLTLISFLLLSSVNVLASGFGQVDSQDLRKVLRKCRETGNETKCLKRNIKRLIRLSEMDSSNASNLVCRSGNNGLFAVYNLDTDKFEDTHYKKSAEDCNRSIRNAVNGLICSVGNNGEYAIKNYENGSFLSPNYSTDIDSCVKALQYSTDRFVCVNGGNSKFARYDLQTGKFLDARYSMTIETCTSLIP
jgi:hypothetical protein